MLMMSTSKNRSPEVQNKTRGPTLFFSFFPTKERDIWCGFIDSRQVMTINNIICIREGVHTIFVKDKSHDHEIV